MSKAKHALITSAKPTPTRRSAVSTGKQTAATAAHPPSISTDLARARELVVLLTAAGKALGSANEKTGEYEAVQDEISRHFHALIEVSNRIWATPVRSWADVVERAEIAAYFKTIDDDDGGGYSYFESGKVATPPAVGHGSGCGDDAMKASDIHLIRAALKMGGAHV
jgi:hypothetical protein